MFPADWIHRPYFSVPDELFGVVPANATEAYTLCEHIDVRTRQYMQDIHLFIGELEQFIHYFMPSPLALEILSGYPPVPGGSLGVHVRRGDNVYDPGVPNKAEYHLVLPVGFYDRGIAQLSTGGPLAVFSDDIGWCKSNIAADFYGDGRASLKEHEAGYFSQPLYDWIDLFRMMSCNSFVIGGSTFGIWSALLSESGNVVRPDKVYGPRLDFIDSELLFHPDWKVLHVA